VDPAVFVERAGIVLRRLSSICGLRQHSLQEAVKHLTEAAAWAGSYDLSSVWIFTQGRSRMRCIDLFEHSASRHSAGQDMAVASLPRYVSGLEKSRCVAATNALADPGTSELAEAHLRPQKVVSLLHAPVRIGGIIAGVVGFESLGRPRQWSQEDASFAASLADLVALALEANERRRAEDELRRTVSVLHATLDSTGDGLLVLNPQGQVAAFNDHFLTLFALPAASKDGGGEKLLEAMLQKLESPDALLAKARDAAETPEVSLDCTLRLKDGRTLDCTSQPQRIEGKIVGRVWNFRDVTDRCRAEQERSRLATHLQEAQKLEALSTLAGGIAHDFNNILMAMLGNAELAMAELPPQGNAQQYLQEIMTAGTRAEELIKRIFTISRKSTGESREMRNLELAALVEDVVKLMRTTLPPHIAVQSDVPATPLYVRGDLPSLHQVLLGLCTNAVRAMRDKGGRLSLRATAEMLTPEAAPSFPGMKAGKVIHLAVSDTGCGMDAATLKRLFDPFFSTKPPGEGDGVGLGLGLAVAQGILRNHHGLLSVESVLGSGTTVHLLLPAAESFGQPAGSSQKPTPAEKYGGHGERLLVIEDEPAIAEFLRRGLASMGYQAAVFSQPVEALEVLRLTSPSSFDAVITDYSMPVMNGVEVARHIKQLAPGMPIMLMSGYEEGAGIAHPEEAGIRKVMAKPLSLSAMSRAIRELLTQPDPVLAA
jgi:PAS domain S-box-containing protein